MAITVDYLSGFESGLIGTAGGNISNSNNIGLATATAAATIITSGHRSGTYGLQVAPTGAAAGNYRVNTLQTAASRRIWRFAIKIPTLPASGSVHVFNVHLSTTMRGAVRVSSTGLIEASLDGTTWVGSTTLTNPTTTYHVVEFKLDYSAATNALTWRVDDVDQTGTTLAAATTAPSIFTLGTIATTGPAATIQYDDVITGIWTSAGDWFGDGEILAYQPASDGTHLVPTAGDYRFGDAGVNMTSATTTAYTMVTGLPWTSARSTTANIYQAVIRTASYMELVPATADPAQPTANYVRAVLSYSATGTTANTGAAIVRNSAGTSAVIWGDLPSLQGGAGGALADYSESTNFFKGIQVPIPGAGWTPTEINAIRWRVGGADDVTPFPTWQGLLLEVDYPIVAASAASVPVAPTRRASRVVSWRRRRPAQVVTTQTVAAPAPYAPEARRRSARGFVSRRRRPAEVVPPQVVVAAPTTPPRDTRRVVRRIGLLPRRDRSVEVVPSQTPPPPDSARRRATPRVVPRRRRPVEVTPPQVVAAPAAFVSESRRRAVRGLVSRLRPAGRPFVPPSATGPAILCDTDLTPFLTPDAGLLGSDVQYDNDGTPYAASAGTSIGLDSDSVATPFVLANCGAVIPSRLRRVVRPPSARRRGRVEVVPAQVAVAPPAYRSEMRRAVRRFVMLPRRDRSVEVTPPQIVVAPPTYRSETRRAVRRIGLLPRRDRSVEVVPSQTPPPPETTRRRAARGFGTHRRGRVEVTPPQVVVAPPAKVSDPRRAARRFVMLPRRDRAVEVTPAQVVVAPPPTVPDTRRRATRGFASLRRRSVEVVPPQIVVTPPTYRSETRRAVRRIGLLPRRDRSVEVVPPQVTPPPKTARRRGVRGVVSRRRRPVEVTPSQVVVTPPSYVPAVPPKHSLRGVPRRTRRADVVPPQLTPPPATPGHRAATPARVQPRRGTRRADAPPPQTPAHRGQPRRPLRIVGRKVRRAVTVIAQSLVPTLFPEVTLTADVYDHILVAATHPHTLTAEKQGRTLTADTHGHTLTAARLDHTLEV